MAVHPKTCENADRGFEGVSAETWQPVLAEEEAFQFRGYPVRLPAVVRGGVPGAVQHHAPGVRFLRQKWSRELDYALRKELWGFRENRIAVRFQYEWHDTEDQWWRSYGNELWEFTDEGLMRRREASINDVRIAAADRRIFGPRPASERGTLLPVR
jgi:hypothetical protein